MYNNLSDHRYRIVFPGGEIVYEPLRGLITDPIKKQSVSLPSRRKFSVFSEQPGSGKFHINDFSPICLTIYPSHHCNLNCTYCYIPKKDTYPNAFIEPAMVKSGAQLVASNCIKRKLPFVAGFHGGNEPLLHPDKLEKYIEICESVARDSHLKFLPFCTTNGVISKDTAYWAAKRFYGITLSWDGPRDIHDAFRKDSSNNKTGQHVERTARIFAEQKCNTDTFLIRCTITSLSVAKMEDITKYFHGFGAKLIEFYPVFRNRELTFPDELIPDSHTFVYNFLKARNYGNSNGIKVMFSGSRLKDFHNRYCMILQDNLTITPDGFLTNCYYCTQNYDNTDNLYIYGKFNRKTNQLEFNNEKMNVLNKIYDSEINECLHCFNQFHCSHGCPDLCPMTGHYNIFTKPDCIREKWLGMAAILEEAGYLKQFKTKSAFLNFFQRIDYQEL